MEDVGEKEQEIQEEILSKNSGSSPHTHRAVRLSPHTISIAILDNHLSECISKHYTIFLGSLTIFLSVYSFNEDIMSPLMYWLLCKALRRL